MSSCRLSSLALLLLTTSSFLLVGEVTAAAAAANLGENRDPLPHRRGSKGADNAGVGFGEIGEAHAITPLAHDEKVADDSEEEHTEKNRLLRSNIFYRGPQKPKYSAKRCYRLINRSCGQCRRYIRKRAANFKCQSTSRCKRQFDFCMAKRQRFFLRKCERFANRWTKASCSPPTKQIGFFRGLPQPPVGRDNYASCSAQPWVRPTGRPANATTSQTSFQITAQLDIVQLCGDSGDVAGQVKKAVIDRFSNVLTATMCAAYFQNINIQINSVSVASNCPREDGGIRRKLGEQSSDLCTINGTTWGTTTCTIEIYGVGDELVATYFPSLYVANETALSEGSVRVLQSASIESGDRSLRASATTSRQLIDTCVCDQSLAGIVPSEDTGGVQCARMISDGAPQTDMPNSMPTASPSSGPSILASPSPSGMPSTAPSSWPSAMPSMSGMPTISSEPSSAPSISAAPTQSSAPTAKPSAVPSSQPSNKPSANPSMSAMPTISAEPSASPTESASPTTSPRPSGMPSSSPSSMPTSFPSLEPSSVPTLIPSGVPSGSPTSVPSSGPTTMPSREPSASPSSQPSGNPSSGPSSMPSGQPNSRPSATPSISAAPTVSPQPSSAPTVSHAPSTSQRPSSLPSTSPSSTPSALPSTIPSAVPSADPSSSPSSLPSSVPSAQPSLPPSLSVAPSVSMKPSSVPTMSAKPSVSFSPSSLPSTSPSDIPSLLPSADPSTMPSSTPSTKPSVLPSTAPSDRPSSKPSSSPSLLPSKSPTNGPTMSNMPSFHYQPSSSPSLSLEPSASPSSMPSYSPSGVPTLVPSANPSALPSMSPSSKPTATASASPSRSHSPTDLASAPPSTTFQGELAKTKAELDAKLKQLEELLKNLTPTRSPAPSVSPAPSLSMAPTQCIAGLGSSCTVDGLACCAHPKNDEYSAQTHVSDLSNSVTCEASSSNFGGGADSKRCCIANNMPCSYEEDGCCNGQCSFVNGSGINEFRCVVGSS